jgi:hypothetical protein
VEGARTPQQPLKSTLTWADDSEAVLGVIVDSSGRNV